MAGGGGGGGGSFAPKGGNGMEIDEGPLMFSVSTGYQQTTVRRYRTSRDIQISLDIRSIVSSIRCGNPPKSLGTWASSQSSS